MATFEKTWAFDLNRAYVPATALDLTRWTMWYLAAALTGKIGGLTLGLWTLYASSDSVTAGTDTTDRWVLNGPYDGAKIVRAWGAAIHSWIVLKSPVMNGNAWYMILSFNSGADTSIRLSYSKTAPTGGSITVSPTSSTDQWVPTNGVPGTALDSIINAGTVDSSRFNIGLASVGDWYLLGCKQGTGLPNLCFQFHSISNNKAADLSPTWALLEYAATGVMRATSPAFSPASGTYTRVPTTLANVAWYNVISQPGLAGGIWGPTQSSQIDNTYADFPCWLLSGSVSAIYTVRGRIEDLAVVSVLVANLPEASVSPAVGQIDSCRAGNLWLPANAMFNFS